MPLRATPHSREPAEGFPSASGAALTDDEVLALSDACWFCLDGVPVAVHDGKPACSRCSEALGEAAGCSCGATWSQAQVLAGDVEQHECSREVA